MRIVRLLTLACVLTAFPAALHSADWNQWLGPGRNGIATGSPALIDVIPDTGLKEIWRSDEIAGGGKGGYGSVVVADGRVYVYSNSKEEKPSKTRKLTAGGLTGLGWSTDLPSDLREKTEAARTSEDRAKVEQEDLHPWILDWIDRNVPDEHWDLRGVCYRRLLPGAKAMPLSVLTKLEAIKSREFESEEAMRHWLTENGVQQKWHKGILRGLAKGERRAYDRVFCIDAATGETIWKTDLPGRYHTFSCSSTPCIADGRCYLMGSDGSAYCFAADTGSKIWQAQTAANTNETMASSFVVHDGVAIVLAGVLTGLNAGSGEVLWTQPEVKGGFTSPAYWRTGGKTYMTCVGRRATFCFDPKTGKILWSVPVAGWTTPAIADDYMVVLTNKKRTGLCAYKLSAEKAEKAWTIALNDRGASPVIHDGHVYVIAGGGRARAACIELESGDITWKEKVPRTELSSPILADGKLLCVVGRAYLYMIKATPDDFTSLGRAKLPVVSCTTPAFADGKVFMRLRDAVACYDLRRLGADGQ